MDIQALLFLIPYGLSFLVSLIAAIYTWRRRDITGAGTYGWVAIGQTAYILGYILERLYADLSTKILWNDVQLIANVGWALAFSLFALRYTNRILPRLESKIYIFAIPALFYAAFIITHPYHNMLRHDVALNTTLMPPVLTYTPSIATWMWTAYAASLSAVGFHVMSDQFLHTVRAYRTQLGAVILGNTLAMISALFTMADIRLVQQHDVTPLVIMISHLIVLWGLTRYKHLEIVPIAWHTVAEQIPNPVFVLDASLKIIDMNPAAEQITTQDQNTVKGQNLVDVVPEWQDLIQSFDIKAINESECTLTVGNVNMHYQMHTTPLVSNRGRHAGFVLVAHDITNLKTEQFKLQNQSESLESQVAARTAELSTAIETADGLNEELRHEIDERRRVEESLRISQERYELATAAGKIAVWEWDVIPDDLYVSPMLQSWIKTSENEIGLKSDDWLGLIHPEDRELVEQSGLQYAQGKIPELHLQHRVVLPSGEVRWFDMSATLIRDTEGNPIRLIGTESDITESKILLDSLSKRDTALEAVNNVAERLLQSTNWQQEAEALLELLGKALRVDRALIINFSRDADGVFIADLASEWCIDSLPRMIGQTQFHNADTSGYKRWFDTWQQGKPVYSHTSELPEEEQRFERAMGIKTLLQMPVMVNGKLFGTISFHHVFEERTWSNAEMEALSTVANMLGTAIERQHALEAQQRYAERLRILQEIDRAILAAESPVNIAKAALEHITDLIPSQRASVSSFDYEADVMRVLATITENATQVNATTIAPLEIARKLYTDIFDGQVVCFALQEFIDRGKQDPIITTLLSEGIQSTVIVPLLMQGRTVGTLNLSSTDKTFHRDFDLNVTHEITDQLAIALQQAWLFEQVKTHAEELEERVRMRTIELENLNDELKRLSNLKDDFVANVSHELRTPIASLSLYHDLLTKRPDKFDTYISALKRETARLFSLVEDLLFLSRMDQNRVPTNFKSHDINALIEEYTHDRTPLAAQKSLHMSLTLEPGLPLVMMDRSMIGQVISVILTNAINYTPDGGAIEVSTHQAIRDEHHWVGFTIMDSGPGIPVEEQPNLFTRFYRGIIALETGIAGTGLGLSIAKEIIDRHHGRIDVESEGIPGKGVAFSVWLPIDVVIYTLEDKDVQSLNGLL